MIIIPNKLFKTCSKPGCPNLTRNTYCDEHKPVRQPRQRDKQKDKVYDRKRGSAASRGYGRRWQEYRKQFLKRNPTCKLCGAKAMVVDHVLNARNNPGLFWTPFNHMALCQSCHSKKTIKYDRGFGHKPSDEIR